MDNLDIIFCTIPYSDLDYIYSAPAILKSVITTNGYTCKTKDFGLVLLELCDRNEELFNRIQSYFLTYNDDLSKKEREILNTFYQKIIEYFRDNPSKYIGITIFSIFTHKATVELLTLIKQSGINSKIIVGGRGAKVSIFMSAESVLKLSKLEKVLEFGDLLKKRKLTDYVVIGDGEDAILDILRGNSLREDYKNDTFDYPLPDYSDYEFNKYLWEGGKKQFPITGSKGCVRDCDFCDVRFQFGRYKYRSGKDIAREMMYISDTLGYRKFIFTDSLVNGGLKIIEEFCSIIADYNDANPEKSITWTGQYICRLPSEMPERLYPLMARAGAQGLTMGAESGSNHVLEAINKKTTVEAVYYELSQFQKYGITCMLLTFLGHWAETHEDFIKHCEMITKIVPFVRSGTISAVTLGHVAMILEGTPSTNLVAQGSILVSDFNRSAIWFNKENPSNTYKERVLRRIIVHKLAKKLQIQFVEEYQFLSVINSIVKKNYAEINDFYEQCSRDIKSI